MIKLVILDFDDTLSLTEEAFFYLENKIAEKLGFPPMTREAHQKNWGKPVKEAIRERIPGMDPDKFMQIHKEYFSEALANGEADRISDENIATLVKLKSDGKRLAILTSRTYQEVEHLLDENHHINNYVEKIYHMDNSEYHKPDPRVFKQILKDFSVTPQEAVYVGDSVGDAAAAKGAGLHFIAVLESGLRIRDDFKSHSVDYFALEFSDILSFLKD